MPCLNTCAAELTPLAGTRQSSATGQAEDLPGTIGAYSESKEVLQGGEYTKLGDEGARMLQLFDHGENCENIPATASRA